MKQQILSINFQVENTKRRIEVQTRNFSGKIFLVYSS